MPPTTKFRSILILGCAWVALFPVASAAKPPNILFLLVDDLGKHDLSVEGSPFYETPHIDALAARGMRFTHGYAACQVCSPSRASIFLGQSPARHGITDWIGAASGEDWQRNDRLWPATYVRALPATSTTLAEALQAAGYATFFAGKWHLGPEGSWPEDHGFAVNRGGWDVGSPHGGYFAPWENPNLPAAYDGESLPDRLARETQAFLESSADRPFFAVLSFYSVHGPIQTTAPLWQKYRRKAIAQASTTDRAQHRFLVDRTLPVRQVQDNPIYAGMLESLDEAVGRVLETLNALEISDDTIVVFTSDNGGVSSGDAYATSNLPLRGGKGRQWEGGLRVPFYVVAPGVTPAGATCDTPVIGWDFYPTLLSLAKVPLPPEHTLDGKDLTPLLQGSTIPERPLVWHYPHYGNQGGEPSSVIRQGNHKLIHYWEDDRDELYDLSEDPGEQQDLSQEQPERTSKLRETLRTYLAQQGAQEPRPNPHFDANKMRTRRTREAGPWKEQLEKRHAQYLNPQWQPNATWWDSMLAPQD